MTITVLDSKDLITHLTTGETPIPAGVAEDNARQKAAADKENGKSTPDTSASDKTAASKAEGKTTAKNEGDDVEDADGLTPAQKRELSATMLKAIGKKHREMKEAEEFAAEQYNQRRLSDQRAEAAERRMAEQEAARQSAAKVEEAKEPMREKFATDKEYADALIDWRVDQKLKQKQTEDAARAAQEEQQRVVTVAQERLAKAAELVPDFTETVDTDLNIPGHIAAYMQRSSLFAELGYHFAKHPEVLNDLRKLHPADALVEVGVIKSTLKPFSETHSGKASNGPEPSKTNGAMPSTTDDSPSKPRGTAPVITPLPAGGSSQVTKDPAEMNIRETISDWQKKNHSNLERRKRH